MGTFLTDPRLFSAFDYIQEILNFQVQFLIIQLTLIVWSQHHHRKSDVQTNNRTAPVVSQAYLESLANDDPNLKNLSEFGQAPVKHGKYKYVI